MLPCRDSRNRPLAAGLSLALGMLLGASALPLAAEEPRNPLSRGLPDWLELRFEGRLRTESRTALQLRSGNDDTFLLSRQRIGLGGEPWKHVRFYVEGQDSRIAGLTPESALLFSENPLDLRQAWVEFGKRADGPIQLKVGRQSVRYGGERLFGERRWSNLSPTWDAARLTLRRGRNALDVFSMSMTDPNPGFDRPFPAAGHGDVHGFYGALESLLPNVVFEPYLLYVARPRGAGDPDLGPDAGAWSGGLRMAGRTDAGWEYEAEWTEQHGHARETPLRGGMGAVQVAYGGPDWPWRLRIHAEHEYASGDKNPGDGRITTYDSLFAARRLHLGLMNVIGRRNIRALETGVQAQPAAAVRVRLEAHVFWVASRFDALYGVDGTPVVAAPAEGAASSRAGEEIDLTVLWTPAPYLEVESGAMRFFSGPFVRESQGDAPAGVLLFVAMTLRL